MQRWTMRLVCLHFLGIMFSNYVVYYFGSSFYFFLLFPFVRPFFFLPLLLLLLFYFISFLFLLCFLPWKCKYDHVQVLISIPVTSHIYHPVDVLRAHFHQGIGLSGESIAICRSCRNHMRHMHHNLRWIVMRRNHGASASQVQSSSGAVLQLGLSRFHEVNEQQQQLILMFIDSFHEVFQKHRLCIRL